MKRPAAAKPAAQTGISSPTPCPSISPPLSPPPLRSSLPTAIFAVLFGCLLSLTLTGYQIGESNHTVYLLDGIRHADPELFSKDWFVTGTLQYHGLFSYVTRTSIKLGILKPVFLVGYLLTVLAFHYWIYRLITTGLRGAADSETKSPLAIAVIYLLTVVLYHLSAGGTGLGGFQFLQDSAFLPSNVANVAMLAGIVLLMERRIWSAAIALGLSGIFHINHAVFAPLVFAVGGLAIPNFKQQWKPRIAAGFLVGVLCFINLGPSLLHLSAEKGPTLTLPEFVDIYAKLRHPHHYYPRVWHPMVYIGALWTFIPAGYFLLHGKWRLAETPRRVGFAIAIFLNAAAIFALIFAGVTYISERLIQMAVFRFTIYPILLSCAVVAWGLFDSRLTKPKWTTLLVWIVPLGLILGVAIAWSGVAGELAETFVRQRPAPFAFAALLIAAIALLAQFRNRELPASLAMGLAIFIATLIIPLGLALGFMGLNFLRTDPPAYTRLAQWCKANTPKDALFIVPPNDQAFRIAANRSIFINFKAIPQTAKELPEWRRRMQLLTGIQDLPSQASTWNDALKRFGDAYAARPESELVALARQEGARYILTPPPTPTSRKSAP